MNRFLRVAKTFCPILVVVVTFTACNYVEPPPSLGNTETVFYVELDETETSNTYKAIRLTLVDAEGTQLALGSGPSLPQAAINETQKINFLIELKTQELLSGKIQALAPNALARGYLRSRYVKITKDRIPENGTTVNLELKIEDLKVGYGPGQLKVADIPYLPDFFIIHLTLTSAGLQPLLNKGYVPAMAVAIAFDTARDPPWDPGLKFDLTKMPPIEEADVLGIASPDTGWYMIMEDEIRPNKLCRYWLFFVKENDFTTSHLYYQNGTIPVLGGVVEMTPDFAGIPIHNVETLKLLALDDNTRAQVSANLPFDISDLSESFVLTSPIYTLSRDPPMDPLSADFWLPIGRNPDALNGSGYSPFKGVFDGGGYTIWSINLTGSAEYVDYGFFGYVEHATLQNFNFQVDPQTLTFHPTLNSENTNVGILAGVAQNSQLKNIAVKSGSLMVTRVTTYNNYVGGVVGNMAGSSGTGVTSSVYVLATGGNARSNQLYGVQ